MKSPWIAAVGLCLLAGLLLFSQNYSSSSQEENTVLKRHKRSTVQILEARAREAQRCPRTQNRKFIENVLKEKKKMVGENKVLTQRKFSRPQPYVIQTLNKSAEVIDMVDCMAEAAGRADEEDLMKEVDSVSLTKTHLSHLCQKDVLTCNPGDKYRSINGSCNNLYYPTWGMTGTSQVRLIKPLYDNQISSPRSKSSVAPAYKLPNPRVLTVATIKNKDNAHPRCNALLTFFGQFLDHDITATPTAIMSESEGGEIGCCDDELRHPDCLPIVIPLSDPVYSKYSVTCMDFVRSAASMNLYDCKLGYREQMNQVTSFVDGSQIYGSDEEIARELVGTDGKLDISPDPLNHKGGLLPLDNDRDITSCRKEFKFDCFAAGDFRANEQGLLNSLHTIWVREHNRIAKIFKVIFPGWDDYKIYHETRRIVIAEIQVITYQEWLPKILGPEFMRTFNLAATNTKYRRRVNPSIVNSFSTAAFRFGHSLLNGVYKFQRYDFEHDTVNLTDMFDNVVYKHMGYLDYIIRGIFHQPTQKVDCNVPDAVTHNLFKSPEEEVGLDLAALNIQRGRDHGLPGYAAFYEFFASAPMTWKLAEDLMGAEQAKRLKDRYNYVEDIDLWLGGINEKNVEGGMVGRTFAYIIAQQFFKLKFGDRFFYEHRGEVGSFTTQQLESIRKTTLSRVICKNSQTVDKVPRDSFYVDDKYSLVSCDDLPDIDFQHWSHL